jgi:hypothetical protein
MVYRHTIDATAHGFDDLRDLQARATPPRSGDRLPETPKKAARGLFGSIRSSAGCKQLPQS